MEMKAIRRGGIERAGYDRASRTLVIEFERGRAKRFLGVGEEVARQFLNSSAPLSFLRDRLEEEYAVREGGIEPESGAESQKSPRLTAAEAAKQLFG